MLRSSLLSRAGAHMMRQSFALQARPCSARAVVPSTLTFGNQGLLEPLPVPTLEETCSQYLRSCVPILSEEQLTTTEKAVNRFHSGVGQELQKRLLKHADEQNAMGKSWLEDWWLKAAYLGFRMPLPANSNYSFIFDNKDMSKDTERAAKYIRGTVEFKNLLDREALSPEYLRRTTPQCMEQNKEIFTVCRVPQKDCDVLRRFVPSRHAIVICRKQIFKLDVVHPNGEPYRLADLTKQLDAIKAHAIENAAGQPAVGAMTAADRDVWNAVRLELLPDNKETFDIIERALLSVTLDSDSPKDESELAAYICAGGENTAPNRWYDKTIQYIVFENGCGGLNGEHTPLDAPIVGRMTDYVLDLVERNAVPDSTTSEVPPPFQPLTWKMSSETRARIDANEQEQKKVMQNLKMRVLRFRDYGAEWIKRSVKASPDAFTQMGMQYAYYKVHKACSATYETGTTRAFLHGRTDTVRSCSVQSKEWTEAMEDERFSREEKREMLRAAINAHSGYMKRATEGKAVDRHLLGLRMCVQPGEDMPEIFTDYAYRQSSRYRVSTSNMPGQLYLSGFGATEADGYGICYGTRKDMLQFTVSSFNHVLETDCEKFRDALQASLVEMRALFDEQARL